MSLTPRNECLTCTLDIVGIEREETSSTVTGPDIHEVAGKMWDANGDEFVAHFLHGGVMTSHRLQTMGQVVER